MGYMVVMAACTMAQVAEQGRFLGDIYFSYANYTKLSKRLNVGSDNLQSRHFPVSGVRMQYALTPHWTAGAEANYSHSSFDWREDGLSRHATGTRLALLGRAEFHTLLDNELDVYGGVATGLAINSYRYPTSKVIKPSFTFRASAGARYFFSEYVGVMAEIGFGGSCIMQAGVSGRMNDGRKTHHRYHPPKRK